MQDGAVTAEGDKQIGALDLLLQLPDRHAQLVAVALPTERQAHHRFKADLFQKLTGALCHGQFIVPIGVRAEDHSFHSLSLLSFSSLWEASTSAARSGMVSGSPLLRR